jgi:hypothetical protein
MSPLRFVEERRQKQEMERRIKIKEGRRRAERHIVKQKELMRRYWDLATRAYRLGDKVMFKKLAALISSTRVEVNNWERRMLYFDVMESRADQAAAGAEFAKAFEAMANSVLANANPADLAKIQMNVERSAMMADVLQDRLEDFTSVLDEQLVSVEQERPDELRKIMEDIEKEAETSAEPGFDADIEASLKQIDAVLKREGV